MFNDFLIEIEEKDIQISFSDGKLQYNGPEQNVDEKLITKLIKYKSELANHFWPEECQNIFPVSTEGDLTPLVLLHGGTISQLSEYLGINRPLYSFMHLGAKEVKIRYKNVESFAEEYIKQFEIVLPKGSYILGGMSMGGHLAYEIAIQLQNRGYQIPYLVIVDSAILAYEPKVRNKQFNKSLSSRIYEMLKQFYRWSKNNFDYIRYEIFKSFFYDKLPINKRTSYIVRVYYQLLRNYKPVSEFKGELLLFRASDNNFNSEYLGWEKVCKNITIVHYEGDHSAMFDEPGIVKLIKSQIAGWLEKKEI
jgi:thioesterase domain-containing protein